MFYIIDTAVTQTDTLICLVEFVGNGASKVAQMVKNLSACKAGDLDSLSGSRRSPEEGNATHSSILAWRTPWTEELGGLLPMGSQRVDNTLMVY